MHVLDCFTTVLPRTLSWYYPIGCFTVVQCIPAYRRWERTDCELCSVHLPWCDVKVGNQDIEWDVNKNSDRSFFSRLLSGLSISPSMQITNILPSWNKVMEHFWKLWFRHWFKCFMESALPYLEWIDSALAQVNSTFDAVTGSTRCTLIIYMQSVYTVHLLYVWKRVIRGSNSSSCLGIKIYKIPKLHCS